MTKTPLDLDRAERCVRQTIASHGPLDALGYALQAIAELREFRGESPLLDDAGKERPWR